MLDRLNRLDDRALNAWWGAFATPFAWAAYRLGYALRDTRMRGRDTRAVGRPLAMVYRRGAVEGRPLRGR